VALVRWVLGGGWNALTEHDRFRHGRQAVALARVGLAVTQGRATPALAAELHAKEARGLALLPHPQRPNADPTA
jgi:hypothetical protein